MPAEALPYVEGMLRITNGEKGMNVSHIPGANQVTRTTSVLRTGNKQPELALQLLLKSVEGVSIGVQTAAAKVLPASSTPDTGQLIDILV